MDSATARRLIWRGWGEAKRSSFKKLRAEAGGSRTRPYERLSLANSILFLVGLPETKRCAGWVDDDAQPAHTHHFRYVLHHVCAQCPGFLSCGGDVVHLNVCEPRRRRAGDGMLHDSAAGALADFNHRVGAGAHRNVFELPVKKFSVK